MGIAAFVLSLVAWPMFFLGILPGFICAILAIIFGAIVSPKGKPYRGLGITGLVFGLFFLIYFVGGTGLMMAGF